MYSLTVNAIIIQQKGIGQESLIFEFPLTDGRDVWEQLDNICVELENSERDITFEVGDMIKIENNLYTLCNEGFIQI